MRRTCAGVWALAVVLTMGGVATAGGREGGEQPADQRPKGDYFSHMDTDGDGRITREEFKGNPEMFSRLDLNNDGVISREEVAEAKKRWAQQQPPVDPMKRILELDANGDGRISEEERKAWKGPPELLNRLDLNRDGIIDREELQAARKHFTRREPGEHPRPPGEGPAPGPGQGPPPSPAHRSPLHPLFLAADTDRDNRLSQEELRGLFEKLRRADANNDNFIDMREFMEAVGKLLPRPDRLPPGAEARQPGPRSPAGPEPRPEAPGPARPPAGGVPPWFERMDADGDGRVSLEEFTGPEERFKHLDRNGDGFIDRREVAPAGPPPAERQPPPPRQEPPPVEY